MSPELNRMLNGIEQFMEWDSEDHSVVTTFSAALFAEHVSAPLRARIVELQAAHEAGAGTIEHLRKLLKEAQIHVVASAGAEHLLDGFRPRKRPLDDLVKQIEEVLS